MKKQIGAEIIADSICNGHRITSMVVTIPRIVLAEWNTHRALSRNSSSSRAIPFDKMVQEVDDNPFIPLRWQKDHSGMQGTEYFTEDEVKALAIRQQWLDAKNYAVHRAKQLNERGLTKQLCNRLLEPFMYQTIICTATEWENFIALRAHEAAEIHIQEAAYCILSALNTSQPRILNPGEWHIPFGDRIHEIKVLSIIDNYNQLEEVEQEKLLQQTKVKIAIARCARVSYLNFEGKDDYYADIRLFDRLSEAGHMSPFEHVAVAMNNHNHYGNFVGWKQYRQFLDGENKSDERIIKG